LVKHLTRLAAPPANYLYKPWQQFQVFNAMSRNLIFALDEKGAEVLNLAKLPFERDTKYRNFEHGLMLSRIMVSFEVAAKTIPGIHMIYYDHIVASEHCPKIDHLEQPHLIRCGEHYYMPDYRPFGLEVSGKYFFFNGIEADRDTEDLRRIKGKYENIIQILEGQLHKQWGLPHLYFPFITIRLGHMQNMLKLWYKMTEHKPSLRKWVLFKQFPDFYDKPKPAGPHMVTEPWHRAGYPVLQLMEV
jgi:hypothetical protein